MTEFFNHAAKRVERFVRPRYQAFIKELKQYPPYFRQLEKYTEALQALNRVVALMETQEGKNLFLWMVLTDRHLSFSVYAERCRMTPRGMFKYVAGNYNGWMYLPLHKILESRDGLALCIPENIQRAFLEKLVV
ncbi:MAG TPA: hypothetical protein VLG69_02730 [Candidatus Andersenbacteria bacterium]|nr:hypothetical protein [Candidatus Andersenbacteria bacterium]